MPELIVRYRKNGRPYAGYTGVGRRPRKNQLTPEFLALLRKEWKAYFSKFNHGAHPGSSSGIIVRLALYINYTLVVTPSHADKKRSRRDRKLRRLQKQVDKLVRRERKRKRSPSSSSDDSSQTSKRSRSRRPSPFLDPGSQVPSNGQPNISSNENQQNSSNDNCNILPAGSGSSKCDTSSLLGDLPKPVAKMGPSLHPQITERWNAIAKSGLSKEERDKLLDKYPIPERMIIAGAKINPELTSAIPDVVKIKDDSLRRIQDHIATASAAIGNVLGSILDDKMEITRHDLISKISDAGRYLLGTQYALSTYRRKQVAANIKDPTMTRVLNDSEVYPFLFGQQEVWSPPHGFFKLFTTAPELGVSNHQEEQSERSSSPSLTLQVSSHAGRLKQFYHEWLTLPSVGKKVLSIINGYKLPFKTILNPTFLSNKEVSIQETNDIDTSIRELIQLGAIERCNNDPNQFVSPIFLVPKPDGSKRFIINLKHLNEYLQYSKFKMEDLRSAIRLMENDCYMTTIDLKNAYYLISVSRSDRKFLRFSWKGELYQFNCLCFGLSSAPTTFTKILRPVMRYLRISGIRNVIYLDNPFTIGNSYENCLLSTFTTIRILEKLGYIINYDKSKLIPSKSQRFLGFILNSSNMTVELPREKAMHTIHLCKRLLDKNTCTVQQLAEFTGTLVACFPAIRYGPLYTKLFESTKFLTLLQMGTDYKSQVILNKYIHEDVKWWLTSLTNPISPIRTDVINYEYITDASLSGWGAHCNGVAISGLWDGDDKKLSINYLELKAAWYGLRSFGKSWSNGTILLRIDNTTALSNINKMGSIQFLHFMKLTRLIWNFCESRNLWLVASYIRSKDNDIADFYSRVTQTDTEWSLSSKAFNKMTTKFGSPSIDLFATLQNAKCSIYVSWKPDPFASNIDAFTLSWTDLNFYAFPPFSMILRVLRKIKTDQATGLVVVTHWECQPWFPLFKSMLISPSFVPFTFTDGRSLVREALKSRGLDDSADTIINSLSNSTWKQYESSLRCWSKFTNQRQLSIFITSPEVVASFLTEMLKSVGYSSINTARSALSLLATNSEFENIGSNPVVKRVIKGVAKMKPPKPRYDVIWDATTVTEYLKTLWPHDQLSISALTEKCVTLLALCTAQRCQTLSKIKISEVKVGHNQIDIFLTDQVKTSGPGKFQPHLILPKFEDHEYWCIMTCVRDYISRTQEIRTGDELFVGLSKPHRPVGSQTIGRWIKNTLSNSGVDVTLFKAHSVRHASTSKALSNGTNIEEIRSSAGWTPTSSTFAKFYNRPIITDNNFAKSVFNIN
ncbi:putative enzymatic polyprotein [Folsomia candida]|uniref:Putative enzymatic polyprotein n=1 Tax=Folsomia candida TaxID=158441 RepID=A0A226DM48_FOLCA|nr:putative enzymatic polyprotein [Folsomia candida]